MCIHIHTYLYIHTHICVVIFCTSLRSPSPEVARRAGDVRIEVAKNTMCALEPLRKPNDNDNNNNDNNHNDHDNDNNNT